MLVNKDIRHFVILVDFFLKSHIRNIFLPFLILIVLINCLNDDGVLKNNMLIATAGSAATEEAFIVSRYIGMASQFFVLLFVLPI